MVIKILSTTDKEVVNFEGTEIGFIKHFKSSPYKLDQFVDLIKEHLQENGFIVSQAKIKTGEAITYAGGITLHGEVGGGVAATDISKLTWNPMQIKYKADKSNYLEFKGTIKINESHSFQKKVKNLNINLGDYELVGGIKWVFPAWIYCIIFVVGLVGYSIIETMRQNSTLNLTPDSSTAVFVIVLVLCPIVGISIKKYSEKAALKETNSVSRKIKKVFDLIVEEGKNHYEDITNR